MATIYNEDIIDIELTTGTVSRNFANHVIGYGDEYANRYGVRVFRNGEPVQLTGTCRGYFIRNADEVTVMFNGYTDANKAWVVLPENCYLLEGGFSLMENAREHGISGRVRFMSRNESLSQMRWEGAATLGLFVEMAKPPAQTQDAAMQSMLSIRSLLDGRAGYVIFATSHLTRESVGRLIECHNAGVPLLVVHALPRDTHSEFSRQLSYDDQLWQNSIGVISLKDGPQIVKEVAAQ